MNNLLFTALIIALLYYFFYYLPQQKKLIANPPLPHHQSTQTDELEPKNTVDLPGPRYVQVEPEAIPNPQELDNLKKDIQQKERTITGLNNSYNKLETKKNQELEDLKNQITNLQTQIRELVKRPLKPTNSKSIQTDSEVELTNTLDTLIKGIQELNNEL